MCYVWILYAAEAVAAVGGAYYSAESQKNAGEYNNAVAKVNSKISEDQAKNAEALGSQQADEQRMRTILAIGQQKAALAANNVEVSTGTPLDVLGDTALFGNVDERRIRANAARDAWGFRTQGMNYRAQGSLAAYQGRMGSTATLIGGVGQAFGGLNSAGAFRRSPAAGMSTGGGG